MPRCSEQFETIRPWTPWTQTSSLCCQGWPSDVPVTVALQLGPHEDRSTNVHSDSELKEPTSQCPFHFTYQKWQAFVGGRGNFDCSSLNLRQFLGPVQEERNFIWHQFPKSFFRSDPTSKRLIPKSAHHDLLGSRV